MKRRFYTLDVFTDRPLTGNPLAVIVDSIGLRSDDMQAIAREFNLSETVFLFDTKDPVNTVRARIFTPTGELPFAGHPTIGTAVLVAELRAPEMVGRDLGIVIEENIGPVRCTVRLPRGSGAAYASFEVPRLPERVGDAGSIDELAAALSLQPADIGFGAHQPGVWSAGTPMCFVPVSGLEAIGRAKPGHGLAAAVGVGRGAYLYTRDTIGPTHTVHARMFGASVGIVEDPATGAAAAAFAGVATRYERPEDGSHAVTIEQGFEMGRPSLITLSMEIVEGRLAVATIGGSAVRVSEGTLTA